MTGRLAVEEMRKYEERHTNQTSGIFAGGSGANENHLPLDIQLPYLADRCGVFKREESTQQEYGDTR